MRLTVNRFTGTFAKVTENMQASADRAYLQAGPNIVLTLEAFKA